MSDFYSAGALGQIAGELRALNTSLSTDRLFDEIERRRGTQRGLDQLRAEWAAAYEQLRQIALDLEAKNARLEAEVAQKQAEVSRRDLEIVNLERQVFDRDGKIHDLESEAALFRRRWGILMDAVTDYRIRLGIASDKYDAGTI
jgi:chromosome segregation ATPase